MKTRASPKANYTLECRLRFRLLLFLLGGLALYGSSHLLSSFTALSHLSSNSCSSDVACLLICAYKILITYHNCIYMEKLFWDSVSYLGSSIHCMFLKSRRRRRLDMKASTLFLICSKHFKWWSISWAEIYTFMDSPPRTDEAWKKRT